MTPYHEINELSHVYLEDSYVTAIRTGESVELDLDLVLCEDHPDFQPPPNDVQYCYRRGRISFPGATGYRFKRSELKPAFDASGQQDLGNIDTFNRVDFGFHLEGDWGELDVFGERVRLELTPID